MLLGMLDGFRDTELLVPDADNDNVACRSFFSGRSSLREEEKRWLPCPKVSSNGLSENARKRLKQCRDCKNQILKAAMAIKSSVLPEMEMPDVFLETLPKGLQEQIKLVPMDLQNRPAWHKEKVFQHTFINRSMYLIDIIENFVD